MTARDELHVNVKRAKRMGPALLVLGFALLVAALMLFGDTHHVMRTAGLYFLTAAGAASLVLGLFASTLARHDLIRDEKESAAGKHKGGAA